MVRRVEHGTVPSAALSQFVRRRINHHQHQWRSNRIAKVWGGPAPGGGCQVWLGEKAGRKELIHTSELSPDMFWGSTRSVGRRELAEKITAALSLPEVASGLIADTWLARCNSERFTFPVSRLCRVGAGR